MLLLDGPTDWFCLSNLFLRRTLHVASKLLFVYYPSVVLAVVSMHLLLLYVFVGGQSAKQLPHHSFHLVVLELVPDCVKINLL